MADIPELQGTLPTEVVSDGGGTQAAITVGTTATLMNVSGTNLVDRKTLSLFNNGSVTIYWGYTSGVTTTTGTPLFKNQFMTFAVGPDTNVYAISGSAGQNIRVTESA